MINHWRRFAFSAPAVEALGAMNRASKRSAVPYRGLTGTKPGYQLNFGFTCEFSVPPCLRENPENEKICGKCCPFFGLSSAVRVNGWFLGDGQWPRCHTSGYGKRNVEVSFFLEWSFLRKLTPARKPTTLDTQA